MPRKDEDYHDFARKCRNCIGFDKERSRCSSRGELRQPSDSCDEFEPADELIREAATRVFPSLKELLNVK